MTRRSSPCVRPRDSRPLLLHVRAALPRARRAGRGPLRARSTRRAGALVADRALRVGLALVAGALNSPLETIAAQYLLLAHLLQNVMISDWAPPLLIIGLTPAMRVALARRGGPRVRLGHAPAGRTADLAGGLVRDPSGRLLRRGAAQPVAPERRAPRARGYRARLLVAGDLGRPPRALGADSHRVPGSWLRAVRLPRARAHLRRAPRSTTSTRTRRVSGG